MLVLRHHTQVLKKQPCIVVCVLSYLEKRHKEVDGVSLQMQPRSPLCPTS